MKVLKKGFENEITCPKCRAVLLYVSNDIYHCGDLEGDYYDCVRRPECNTDIEINKWY